MKKITSRNTQPELIVRSLLHSLGFRFRLYDKYLSGKPDIVLPKYKTVIFVHGCFWHRHIGCKKATIPKSNADYWNKKFLRNVDNDIKNKNAIEELGWKVIVIWECETNDINKLTNFLIANLK